MADEPLRKMKEACKVVCIQKYDNLLVNSERKIQMLKADAKKNARK